MSCETLRNLWTLQFHYNFASLCLLCTYVVYTAIRTTVHTCKSWMCLRHAYGTTCQQSGLHSSIKQLLGHQKRIDTGQLACCACCNLAESPRTNSPRTLHDASARAIHLTTIMLQQALFRSKFSVHTSHLLPSFVTHCTAYVPRLSQSPHVLKGYKHRCRGSRSLLFISRRVLLVQR